MSQLKRNAFYNTAYQIIRIIFPILTYPYVSRILGPEGIGKVSYAQTFAEYFTTFSMLGLPIYAVREISRSRAYPNQLGQTVGELLSLSFFLSVGAFLLYALSILVAPKLAAEPLLHWIFGITVIFNWANLDWFFQGVEDYKYITVRNLLLRIVSIFLIFLVIRSKDHYILYGFLWVLSTIISSLWNLWYCYRLAHPQWNMGSWKKHLINSLPSALLTFSLFIYATIDTIMLGVLIADNKYSVGLYNVAGRIVRIVMTIIGGINAGLIPRLSYIAETGDEARIYQIVQRSFQFVLYLVLPAMIGLIIVADDLILVFAGSRFKASIMTLRILSFELFFLGIENILSQLMYALKKEKTLVRINLLALVLAILSNLALIPGYRQDGAAAATVFTRLIQAALLVFATLPILRTALDPRKFQPLIVLSVLLTAFVIGLKALLHSLSIVYRLPLVVAGSMLFYLSFSQWQRIEPFLIAKEWIWEKARKKLNKGSRL